MSVAPHPFSLQGKRVLVTGASSGLGRAIAIGAAAEGAEVVLTGRDAGRLQETREAMSGEGHLCVPADLTEAEQRNALVRQTGTIHGLVHCAGIAAVRLLRQVDQKFIDQDFGINFDAPILLTQRLLASRQIAQGGSIVFIGSIAAHIGTLASSIYSASKGALKPAGRALALELGPKQKIRVNYVAVSYVETPMLVRLAEQGMGSSMEVHTEPPLGKGTPQDVANSAVFLLADASRWITRATLYVDGGLTCQISAQ
ncbi:SDR family NAD(P)-dependent oxidoreductase [Xylophilus ampelinus]|uniref:NAD(P)-dependent dehydrogenase (Short-subunit alcohol dehydrogenase family) n=1 Tax=Xylophilus ampelinus TaxID=54067 RepID=A0A318SW26_9BURK|nr:SDR family oxidoreductase [Xylophilus ampelinus]MCS4511201.1 SDR family oxidoreductase [Xylophilus ampelinus]PYE75044.1 NAD(P)-dependent dehydrogenase (short-subunit alcohol dehydrogenase family) [Xylophilus ampelinus]